MSSASLLPFYPLLLNGGCREQMGGSDGACRYGGGFEIESGRQTGGRDARNKRGERDALILILKTHMGNMRRMGRCVCDQHI